MPSPQQQSAVSKSPERAAIADIKVLDVDTHLTEPPDLWTSRAPSKYKNLVPRVEFIGQDNDPYRAYSVALRKR